MNKKMLMFLLVTAFVLSGCQLAVPEEHTAADVPQSDDLIIGMLISVDTFTPGNSDGLHLFSRKGERLYAELIEESYETSDGTLETTHTFVFPENSGISFMGYKILPEMIPGADMETDYWSSTLDEGIYLEKNAFHTVNEDSFVQLEAVVYVEDTATDLVLYMNPVYQNDAGEVYALGISPMGYQAVSMYDCSLSYGQKMTESINGEIVDEESGYVKMTIKVIHLPDCYRIIQMDQDNKVLTSEDFLPEELPEMYVPKPECAYLILEEYTEGEEVVRTVKSPEDDDRKLEVYYPLESGICHKGHTQIEWEGTE